MGDSAAGLVSDAPFEITGRVVVTGTPPRRRYGTSLRRLANGDLLACYHESASPENLNDGTAVIVRSRDGGRSWDPPVALYAEPGAKDDEGQFFPSAAGNIAGVAFSADGRRIYASAVGEHAVRVLRLGATGIYGANLLQQQFGERRRRGLRRSGINAGLRIVGGRFSS